MNNRQLMQVAAYAAAAHAVARMLDRHIEDVNVGTVEHLDLDIVQVAGENLHALGEALQRPVGDQ